MQLSSPSISIATAGASGNEASSAPDIEHLQCQLKNLQKSMQDLPAQNLPPDQTREQTQLLGQQIQIVQAQIARLQAQNSLEQAETRSENRHSASKSASGTSMIDATTQARTTAKVTGSSTLSDAWLQTRHVTQTQVARAAHPASTEAITSAEPPLVSVKT